VGLREVFPIKHISTCIVSSSKLQLEEILLASKVGKMPITGRVLGFGTPLAKRKYKYKQRNALRKARLAPSNDLGS